MKKILSLLLIAFTAITVQAQEQTYSTSRFVGGDISLLPSYEQYDTPYKTNSGATINNLVTYAANTLHWNSCRVRLFVNPVITNADGTKQGEVQDLAYVTALGRRIKDAGMAFMLDFHYSDTWADPVKQFIPRAWESLSEQELYDTMYTYTKECLETLVAAGATPDFVQIGNEISYGMLWRDNSDKAYPTSKFYKGTADPAWTRFAGFLNQGARAVREVCPEAKIIIHIERTAKWDYCTTYFQNIAAGNVDYDIIGLSYYPFWHGWMNSADGTQLKTTLEALHNYFPNRNIQIVETAYYNNYFPFTEDAVPSGSYYTADTWPASPAGQKAYLDDLVTFLADYDYVNGLYYWFPEENGCGGTTYNDSKIVIKNWVNRGLFDPNSHRAYAGLNSLGAFLPATPSGLEAVQTRQDGIYYSVTGLPMGTDYETLPAGLYIFNGTKILK